MSYKKSFILPCLVLGVALASCSSGSYTISGAMPEGETAYEGEWIYLYNYDETVLDSAQIKDGKFAFAPRQEVDSIKSGWVTIPQKFVTPIVLEEGSISVDLLAPHATGTPTNDALSTFHQEQTDLHEEIGKRWVDGQKELEGDEPKAVALMEELSEELDRRRKELILATLKKHPNDYAGVVALEALFQSPKATLQDFEDIKADLGDKVLGDKSIKELIAGLEKKAETGVGKPFRDFSGVNPKGEEVRLSDYVGKGHYVLVDFWASWCGPCKREIPNLIKVSEQYGAKGLQVLGVAVWDKMDDHLKSLEELKITYPQIFNEREATELYSIDGIPQIILFAPDGTIAARDLRGEGIQKSLDQLLEQNGGKL